MLDSACSGIRNADPAEGNLCASNPGAYRQTLWRPREGSAFPQSHRANGQIGVPVDQYLQARHFALPELYMLHPESIHGLVSSFLSHFLRPSNNAT